ncbi:MAG: hypothetical protein IKB50_03300 [Clostridia bacterium]|nr:hypothetical protein [Clostridia bacterium]
MNDKETLKELLPDENTPKVKTAKAMRYVWYVVGLISIIVYIVLTLEECMM